MTNLFRRISELELKIENEIKADNNATADVMLELLRLVQTYLKSEDNHVTFNSAWVKSKLYDLRKLNSDKSSMMVVYMVPERSSTQECKIELENYFNKELPILDKEQCQSKRINFDGILYSSYDEKSFTQLYKNGIAEFVLYNINEDKKLYPYQMEDDILFAVNQFVNVLNEDIGESFKVYINILNVNGCYFSLPSTLRKRHTIDRDDLFLPEISIKVGLNQDVQDAFKPAINAFWNAAGFVKPMPKSSFY